MAAFGGQSQFLALLHYIDERGNRQGALASDVQALATLQAKILATVSNLAFFGIYPGVVQALFCPCVVQTTIKLTMTTM